MNDEIRNPNGAAAAMRVWGAQQLSRLPSALAGRQSQTDRLSAGFRISSLGFHSDLGISSSSPHGTARFSENVAGVSAAILFRRRLLGVSGAEPVAGWICMSDGRFPNAPGDRCEQIPTNIDRSERTLAKCISIIFHLFAGNRRCWGWNNLT